MQQNNSLNLIEVVAAIKKSRNQIIVFVFLSLAIAYSVLLLIPKYFQSTAIVVAANPALADKARFFNNNIQGLYSNFGSGDDLDRIYGLANLDTAYKLLVDEFELISYYQLNDDSIKLRRRKAVLLLKEVLCTVSFCGKHSRALTLDNLCQVLHPKRHQFCREHIL